MKYHIWSNEHDGWWRPKSNGYTQNIKDAGTYESEEAHSICISANLHLTNRQRPNESLVPIHEATT